MITLQDCFNCPTSIIKSALFLTSKVAFNYKIGYVNGPNRQTFWEFAANLDKQLPRIESQLKNRSYEFQPCQKLVRHLKANKKRDVFIANWEDRIVDRWLNETLNYLLARWFAPNSYAYRGHKFGLEQCINAIKKSLNSEIFVVKRDVSQYFYTIDHTILLEKLSTIIDPNDHLYDLLRQRVVFNYVDSNKPLAATIGIPFGTSIACVLANIYLNDIDHQMLELPIKYFRYADDFLIIDKDPREALKAGQLLDSELEKLKLVLKPTHKLNISFNNYPGFEKVQKFKHLGLEFTKNNIIRLAREKQRKIINFFKRSLAGARGRNQEERLISAVGLASDVIHDRIRSAAITDYYLKHTTDILQLREMDKLIAQMVIATTMQRKFRTGFFRTIPFKRLRQLGLPSLQHRCNLLRHGKLKVRFLSLYNELKFKRHNQSLARRREKINMIKIGKLLKQSPALGATQQ